MNLVYNIFHIVYRQWLDTQIDKKIIMNNKFYDYVGKIFICITVRTSTPYKLTFIKKTLCVVNVTLLWNEPYDNINM